MSSSQNYLNGNGIVLQLPHTYNPIANLLINLLAMNLLIGMSRINMELVKLKIKLATGIPVLP